jgi:hypothetical protein
VRPLSRLGRYGLGIAFTPACADNSASRASRGAAIKTGGTAAAVVRRHAGELTGFSRMPTDLPPIAREIMGWIGTIVVAGGGGALVAWGIIKLFAEKWLNTKFEARLESLKQEHRKEIERLRLTINTLMDRATKLHQREFDALPEAWRQLNEAIIQTRAIKFQFYANIDRLSEEQLNDYLSTSALTESSSSSGGGAASTNWTLNTVHLISRPTSCGCAARVCAFAASTSPPVSSPGSMRTTASSGSGLAPRSATTSSTRFARRAYLGGR